MTITEEKSLVEMSDRELEQEYQKLVAWKNDQVREHAKIEIQRDQVSQECDGALARVNNLQQEVERLNDELKAIRNGTRWANERAYAAVLELTHRQMARRNGNKR